jgi:inositol transport system permease protein
MTIARGVVLLITEGKPISGMGDAFKQIGQGMLFDAIPSPVIIMLVFLVVSLLMLNRTKFGRYVYAVGGNELAAKSTGVKVNKTIILSFIYNGILTGIAGIVLMSRINSGQPAGAEGYEFEAITAAVVGGTSLMGGIGNIPGTFVGCLIIGILNNTMNLMGVSSYWQQIVKGVIIAIAVIVDFKTKSINLNKAKS